MGLLLAKLEEPPREEDAIVVALAGGAASKPLGDCDSSSVGGRVRLNMVDGGREEQCEIGFEI